MKTMLKVALGVVLGFTVLIVGCVALIGAGAQQVQKESDKTAITLAEYQSAKTGQITRRKIEERFGAPQNAQEMRAEGIDGIPDTDFEQSCIYYNREGHLASIFQFCFDGNGRAAKLSSKASY